MVLLGFVYGRSMVWSMVFRSLLPPFLDPRRSIGRPPFFRLSPRVVLLQSAKYFAQVRSQSEAAHGRGCVRVTSKESLRAARRC